jgi:hypothetical protein
VKPDTSGGTNQTFPNIASLLSIGALCLPGLDQVVSALSKDRSDQMGKPTYPGVA